MAAFPNTLDVLLGLPQLEVNGSDDDDLPRRPRIRITGEGVSATDNNIDGDEATEITIGDAPAAPWKRPVRAACNLNVNGTLTTDYADGSVWEADANGALTADGVTLVVDDEFAFISQISEAQNGIYVLEVVGDGSTAAVARRRSDARTSAQITDGALVFVLEGTANADSILRFGVTEPFELDVDAITLTALSLGGGDATSLQGVTLDSATVGTPNDGDVVTYDSGTGEWIAAVPPGAGSITGPANPADDGKVAVASAGDLTYTASPTLATLGLTNDLTFTQANTSPVIAQADETGGSVNGDTLTVQAQNSTGTTTVGGTLILASGTGTTRPGTVQLNFGSTQGFTLDGSGNLVVGVTASAAGAGNMRLPKDFSIFGRNDAGSADVQLLDWGTAVDELVIGADAVAAASYRSDTTHSFYANGDLCLVVDRAVGQLRLEALRIIALEPTADITTTDATPTTLITFTPASGLTRIALVVLAREQNGGSDDRASFRLDATIDNLGGTVTIVDGATTDAAPHKTAGASAWDAELTTNGTTCTVTFTGAAATNIDVTIIGESGHLAP